MNMDDALQTFFVECRELLEEMDAALLGVLQEEDPSDSVNAIFRAAHTIKGSAGLFGLDFIVAFAHVAESVLDKVRAGALPLDDAMVTLLLACRDQVGSLVDAAAAGHQCHDRLALDDIRLGVGSLAIGAQHQRLHELRDAGALGAVGSLQREQQRHRHLPLAQVGVATLAERLFALLVVEGVVAQLEGQAELAAEVAQLAALTPSDTAEDRSHLGGDGEQHRALALDHREVVRLGHRRVEAPLELQQLALGHRPDAVGKDPEDVVVAVLHDQLPEQCLLCPAGPPPAPQPPVLAVHISRRVERPRLDQRQRLEVPDLGARNSLS